jgi:hypothetical protein
VVVVVLAKPDVVPDLEVVPNPEMALPKPEVVLAKADLYWKWHRS